jgi:hypothetical protein
MKANTSLTPVVRNLFYKTYIGTWINNQKQDIPTQSRFLFHLQSATSEQHENQECCVTIN